MKGKYLVVYDVEGDIFVSQSELTEEQAFDAGCLTSVCHVIPLPLNNLDTISAKELLALRSEFDEEAEEYDLDEDDLGFDSDDDGEE